jgi:hypothetical protein
MRGTPCRKSSAWAAALALVAVAAPAADLGFDRLLFVKRMQHNSNHYYTDYINSAFMPGGNICILDLKSGRVTEVVPGLTGGVFGRFDLSFDGKRIVFAWKKGADEGYRIYECGANGSGLRQLTFPPADEAELVQKYRRGYHHGTDDMDPCYLPDGGICFISTRCQFGILCDSPDIFTTTVLYRMDGDGQRLEKLSNSSVSEATPAVMNDGRILYTRWEYVDKGAVSVKCLWAMQPDGSGSAEIYGADIALPPTFIQGRPIPGSGTKFVALGTPHCPQNAVGTVIRIDAARDTRTREPMTYMTPDVDIRGEAGFAFRQPDGKWAHDSDGRGPLFKDPFPLSERLFLVAHKPAGPPWHDPKGYALYQLEEDGRTELLYRDPEISCFEPMPLRPRVRPPVAAMARDPELSAQGLAACVVQDVYHGLEGVARGAAKWIRINEQVPRPWAARRTWDGDEYDQQHAVVSKDASLGLKVQHGVVPIEADGSAYFLVPADRNLFLQVLDGNFMELQRERTYVNYRPGEKRSCIGCHARPQDTPVAARRSPLALQHPPARPGPQPGEVAGARPLHYPADVQPVWDKHCVRCHNGQKADGGLDLSGTPTAFFCRSYEALMPERRRSPRRDPGLLGPIIGENHPKTGNVAYLPAQSLGSHVSVLAAMLSGGAIQLADPGAAERVRKLEPSHREVHLSPEERIRVTTWIESNGQYYGSYWGRRGLQHQNHPDFRPTPTFTTATAMTPSLSEVPR